VSSVDRLIQRKAGSVVDPTLLESSTMAKGSLANFPQKIGLKVGRKIVFIDPRELIAVHAENSYVSLRLESGSVYLVREPISHVAEKLGRYGLIRIHRSLLVNMSVVEEVRPHSTGEYFVRIRGGKEYMVTRTYKKNLSSLASLWIGPTGFQ